MFVRLFCRLIVHQSKKTLVHPIWSVAYIKRALILYRTYNPSAVKRYRMEKRIRFMQMDRLYSDHTAKRLTE